MSFSGNDYIDVYVGEMKGRIEEMRSFISSVKIEDDNHVLIAQILKLLGIMEGASRMMDMNNIEILIRSLENVFSGVEDEKYEISTDIIKLAGIVFNFIENILREVERTSHDDVDISKWRDACDKAAAGYFFEVDNLVDMSAAGFQESGEYSDNNSDKDIFSQNVFKRIKSINVKISTIDDLIYSYEKLMTGQFLLKTHLEDFERELSRYDSSEPPVFPKTLKEEMSTMYDAILRTQKDIFKLRTLPFSMIFDSLKKEIQSESSKHGKKINVELRDNNLSLDKDTLEYTSIALFHFVRNSVILGIENEETRKALGKDPAGSIVIEASQSPKGVKIIVKDDGQGLDYDNIRARAIQVFPNRRFDIESLPNKDLQRFLFMKGFSSEMTGLGDLRAGVGLDIALDCIKRVRGSIRVESQKNVGTTFIVEAPLAGLTQSGLFVYTGSEKAMLPSHYVQEVFMCSQKDIKQSKGKNVISYRDTSIPICFLSILLRSRQKQITEFPVIILNYLETKIALAVDSIERTESLVITPLPEILRGMSSLQGVVIDENYSVVPVLDVSWIVQVVRDFTYYDVKKYQTEIKKEEARVLVVDDSISTRMVELSMFENAGYFVDSAADGLEALEKLSMYHFDLVVTDTKMPRMDGRTLLQNIKTSSKYTKLPVIIMSTNYNDMKDEFIASGAGAFFEKNGLQKNELLNTAKELLSEA